MTFIKVMENVPEDDAEVSHREDVVAALGGRQEHHSQLVLQLQTHVHHEREQTAQAVLPGGRAVRHLVTNTELHARTRHRSD